jgi:cbb3-type cytochrome oxidase subunit 3
MSGETAYLLFGATLCVALVVVIAFTYARSRKARVEGAKYEMLKDDDGERKDR